MPYTYTTKVGDTARQISHTLMLYGRPLDLTGTTVYFIMRGTQDSTVYVERAANLIDAINGKVRFKFTTGETDRPGLYNCEWRIVFDEGSVLTVPDNDTLTLEIVKAVRKIGNI